MEKNLVSIIMPSYNQGPYLPEALDSVLNQTYPNWECIIIDDGSKDNTKDVVKSYCEKDSRIQYIYQENSGVSAARNNGIAHSKGEYILPLDGDDKIAPEFLELTLHEIVKDRKIRVVYTDVQYFGVRNDVYQLPSFSIEKLMGQNILCITALFRREDFDKTGGFNDNMREGFEDWDFWMSMFQDGKGTAYKIPQILFFYRIKPVSRNNTAAKKNIDYRRIVWENHKEMFSKVYPDPKLTFDYLHIANSREYKLGYLFLHPIDGFHKYLKNRNKS
jgi:glycosyltransferase involved in cell wall biosynthesis